jgi:ligand-binding sensor domain-containing protein
MQRFILFVTYLILMMILILQQDKQNYHKHQFFHCVVDMVFFRNQLWVASYSQGLYFYDHGKWHKRTDITPWISCLVSNNNEIWFGTWMEGYIGYIEANGYYKIIHLPTILASRGVYRVNCILLNKEKVWVGTDGYLLRYCKKIRDWDLLLSVGYISALTAQKNIIWFGTNDGLFKITTLKNQFSLKKFMPKVEITALSIDNDILWVAGVIGPKKDKVRIWQYSLKSHQFQIINISTQLPIVSILPFKSKVLFLTGLSGFSSINYFNKSYKNNIIIYDIKSKSCKHLRFKSKLKTINCAILLDQKLLIGGMGGIQSLVLPLR